MANNTLTLFCLLDGEPPSKAFSIEINPNYTVDKLRKLIKFENSARFKDVDAADLTLWRVSIPSTMDNLRSRIKLNDGMEKYELIPTTRLSTVITEGLPEDTIHLIVQVTSVAPPVPANTVTRRYSPPSQADSSGGLPGRFRTKREKTVEALFSLLYAEEEEDSCPFLFVRAPPMSGKTAMSDLLHYRLLGKTSDIVHLLCNEMGSLKFEAFFTRMSGGVSLFEWQNQRNDRVLLLDEVQVTYQDEEAWQGFFKNSTEGRYSNLRVVAFSAYGSYPTGAASNTATPIVIKPEITFGLFPFSSDPTKPAVGLNLQKEELEEMVHKSLAEPLAPLIWELSGGHVAVAHLMIESLCTHYHNKTQKINNKELELFLRSQKTYQYIEGRCRAIPTYQKFLENLGEHSLLDEMRRIMDAVADCIQLPMPENSKDAVGQLIRQGYLFVNDSNGNPGLRFASFIHMNIWVKTRRTDGVSGFLEYPNMDEAVVMDQVLVATLERLSSTRLRQFAKQNQERGIRPVARERQLQMEFWRALNLCLPLSVEITPEYRASEPGFVDFVIEYGTVRWLWELLVDGDDAPGHLERFITGAYATDASLCTKFVLIDLRQSREVRKFRPEFKYVFFSKDYKEARIATTSKGGREIKLAS